MSYLFFQEATVSQTFTFDYHDGVYLYRESGKTKDGILALQDVEDSHTIWRIIFADAKNVLSGAAKKSLNDIQLMFASYKLNPIKVAKALTKREQLNAMNLLGCFEFQKRELSSGEKKIRCFAIMDSRIPGGVCGMIRCYDHESMTGIMYMFPLADDCSNLHTWKSALGVDAIEYTDFDEMDDLTEEFNRRQRRKRSN